MIDGLKPYPAMRDSGVPWLGKLPAGWEVRKLRGILRRVTKRNRPDLPLLSVVRERGVVRRNATPEDENHNYIPDDLSNYKVVLPGQFAMNKMKAWQGSYGVSQYEGIVSPAYFVFDLAGVEGRFFHVAIRSRAYVPSFAQASDGVRIGQWDLAEPRMREIPFAIPPLPEQAAIVRFLDHADRRIRRYIRAKQKLIKLLEEQKQAIIHRAVTRGLDPNVRLKPSGVEWLGDVPEHWAVRRLKSAFDRIVGGSTPSSAEATYWDGDIVWVTPADVSKSSRLTDSQRRITSDGLSACSAELVPSGSIIVTSRAPVGNVAIADVELCTNQGCKALVPAPGIVDPTFGFQVLTILKGELQSLATGTTFTEISTTRLGDILIPLPPLPEQAAIAAYLDEATASLELAVASTRREIDLLREYRTRLIADVVTGKLDVREAAARLPHEAEEPEPLDEIEAEDEADETGSDDTDEVPQEVEA